MLGQKTSNLSRNAQPKFNSDMTVVQSGWRKPVTGVWKINFDGGKLGDGRAWLGVVFSDSQGNVVVSMIAQVLGLLGQRLKRLMLVGLP